MMQLKQKKIKNRQQIILEKSADQEKRQNKRKNYGYIETLCGAIMLLIGIWLFRQTWGFRLLSVDVLIGKISKYYGVFVLIACVFLIRGCWTIMHTVKSLEKQVDSETDQEIFVQSSAQEEIMENQAKCPVCGKMNDLANKFCTFCGSKIKEAKDE